MKKMIYVRLLNEGARVYRPVPAEFVSEGVWVLEGKKLYDPEDEEWEFLPGEKVMVKTEHRGGEDILVAFSKAEEG